MRQTTRILTRVAVAGLIAVGLGCGSMKNAAAQQRKSNDLKEILMAYHNFVAQRGKPPANLNEFMAWSQKDYPDALNAISKLQGGLFTFYWGVDPAKTPAGPSNTILAYEPTVPASGGLVGMADGSTRAMTAAEFNSAAKPTTPAK